MGKGLSIEDCFLLVGRHFSGEPQRRLAVEYAIPQTTISEWTSQIRQNQQLVAAAMAAA